MKSLDPTVKRETVYIAVATLLCSALMQAVFLILGHWDYTVLLGNLLGAAAAVGNFLLLGISVQKALDKEKKDAVNFMRLSQIGRTLLLFAVALVGYLVSVFNILALVITYLFPRLAIAARPLIKRS